MIKKFRVQGSGFRVSIVLSFAILISLFIVHCSLFIKHSYAQEITILYTGETHAMLYPCSCPIEPDGGVARRATLIKQIKKNNPDALVLDSGGFFAGGLLDQYTQNAQLDMQRTIVNLKAVDLMKYDALALGDDEFNFGREFLEENIKQTKTPFLSCNIDSDKLKGYIMKEASGVKIGIIGVTGLSAMQKADGLQFIEPRTAVNKAIADLRVKGADIIVLLSHLGELEDLSLINEVQGIDIIISGHSLLKEGEPFKKVADTLVLRPSWQGRRLGKATITVKDKRIVSYKIEELRLSDKISDDKDILTILPRCFSDANCKKEGLVGTCQNAGSLSSNCVFSKINKVDLLIIRPKDCRTCETEGFVSFLKRQLPGLTVSFLNHPSVKADKLIIDFGIKTLPVYLLGKEIEKEKAFNSLSPNLTKVGPYYMLKPEFSGASYFVARQKIKGKSDLFISLYDRDLFKILDALREYNPTIHFLTVEHASKFDAARGNLEVEDYLRAVCVQKYYPQIFWDYISCRAKNIDSSWWDDCLQNLESDKIKICAKGKEGESLLRENNRLTKELGIMFGPTYLLDNQEIFGIQGAPKKEELRKIINK